MPLFSMHNNVFYLVTLFHIFLTKFRTYFIHLTYTENSPFFPCFLILMALHIIWELTQIVKPLSNFLRVVTDSF